MLPIIRAQLVTRTVNFAANTGAGGFLPFPDQPILNGCFILGFETFDITDLSVSPNGNPLVSAADTLPIAVTLNKGSDQRLKWMPYTSLRTVTHGGVWKECAPFLCDFQKSGFSFFGNVAGTPPYDLCIMFYYAQPEDMTALGLMSVEQVRAAGFNV